MISKDEIIEKSEELKVHTSYVQRDYVFGWILTGIFTVSNLKDYLILKGGNCLRKAYFENTRYSYDLDFSIQTDVTKDFLRTELNKVCDFAQELSGVIFEKEKNIVAEKKIAGPWKKAYEARLYFKDFYGNPDKFIIKVRLDITEYDKIYLPIQNRPLIHPYSDKKACIAEIRALKLEEVLASKLKCLLQRRHSPDLYDYVFSIMFDTGMEVKRSEVVKTLLKMTIFERSPGILRGLFVDLPFQIFKKLWAKYLICPKYALIDFETAVARFKEHVVEVFGGLPIAGGQLAFFPAEYRNPILEAGSNMNVLDVVYDGIRRMVEPYSLAYKKRGDGVEREYFYVYDTTGGRNSGPGIKTFLHTKIQELNVTDVKFKPRFDVELSKAGEPPKKSYFGKPFGERRSPTRKSIIKKRTPRRAIKSIFPRTSGPTHIYQCPMCQKKFRKKAFNSHLNRHKDKYGNRCSGKMGAWVETKY